MRGVMVLRGSGRARQRKMGCNLELCAPCPSVTTAPIAIRFDRVLLFFFFFFFYLFVTL